ncbi:MAG: hypothetical protein LBR84_08880, partial [Tannerella sp.]|nr:hypothetical protein [Tannerella sp.]
MKQVKAMVRPSLLSGDLRKYRKAGGIIFSLCFFLFSCEKELGYRDKLFPDEVEVVIVTPPDPADGSLLFHENFRRWNREGYDNPPTGDCEADQMT